MVIALRLAQYVGAAILFGSALFALFALPAGVVRAGWPRTLLAAAAGLLTLSTVAGVVAQTAMMAGSWSQGLNVSALSFVVTETGLGRAGAARAILALVALGVLLARRPARPDLIGIVALGGLACVSLAWMGHGAATEGPGARLHLLSDILHVLAAGVWIGALVGFLALFHRRETTAEATAIQLGALEGFAGVGSVLVAVLVATGLVNSWFLVGPTRLQGLWTTPYGQLLLLKLALFAGMLAFAAANRFRLTPALAAAQRRGAATGHAVTRLCRSLALETAVAFAILLVVAWLGTLAPVSAA